MEGFFPFPGDFNEPWRCRRHPSAQPHSGGVCPVCLRGRLLRLCPECAGERPRGCTCPSAPSSASSSSSLSISFLHVTRSGVPHPTGGEPEFRRSRSAAPHRQGGGDGAAVPQQAHGGGRGWSWLWPFARAKKADNGAAKSPPAAARRLPRSMSVGVVPGAYPPDGGGAAHGGGAGRWKGWSRYLPMAPRSFRRTSKVIQARSPSAVTKENLELCA